MKKFIALGSDNKPLAKGVKKTTSQWQRWGEKSNTLKKYGFVCVVAVISPFISGRNFEYVRVNITGR